jgi:hypothetical protein
VRRVPRDERDRAAAVPGTRLGDLEALEKDLLRLLSDCREQKHELLTHQPVTPRKSRESVPKIVNLIFVCFPTSYAE